MQTATENRNSPDLALLCEAVAAAAVPLAVRPLARVRVAVLRPKNPNQQTRQAEARQAHQRLREPQSAACRGRASCHSSSSLQRGRTRRHGKETEEPRAHHLRIAACWLWCTRTRSRGAGRPRSRHGSAGRWSAHAARAGQASRQAHIRAGVVLTEYSTPTPWYFSSCQGPWYLRAPSAPNSVPCVLQETRFEKLGTARKWNKPVAQ